MTRAAGEAFERLEPDKRILIYSRSACIGMHRYEMCIRDSFLCEVVSGELVLKEAEAARWLTKEEFDAVPWLPADQTILDVIRSSMVKKK